MTLSLPELPYAYDALGPYMSAETLEYHHDKHHLAYVDKANDLLKGTDLAGKELAQAMVESFSSNPGLFNQLGQHYNHLHFWNWMSPKGGGRKLPGKLQAAIDRDLGGIDKVRSDFIQAGLGQFGSGWAWISFSDGVLAIEKTPNGENPLVSGRKPILGCDVWEHSYYIDYRNARAKYLEAFFDHLINWEYVEFLFETA